MNTQQAKAEYRMAKWAQVIKERQDCCQTIKEYCEARGISEHAYYYWLRKLRAAACTKLSTLHEPAKDAPQGWVQLSPAHGIGGSVEIKVGGCQISVDSATDLELLKRVCNILRVL